MIGIGMGCSPAVRPFYNHTRETIVRTPLGSVSAVDGGGLVDLTLPALTLAATDTLIGLLEYNDPTLGAAPALSINGRALTQDVIRAFGVLSRKVSIWSLPMNGTPEAAQDLIADFSAGDLPTYIVLMAIKVAGLRQAPAPVDRTASAAGGPSTTQASSVTAATSQAHEFLCGLIGTDGLPVDALGTWDPGWTAGQRSPANADLKEGWRIVNAVAAYQARLTLATSRRYGGLIATYRGA